MTSENTSIISDFKRKKQLQSSMEELEKQSLSDTDNTEIKSSRIRRNRKKSEEKLTIKDLQKSFMLTSAISLIWIIINSFIQINQFFALFVTASIMGIYWWSYIRGGQPLSLRDTFADSIYYLGFLLTVMSLISSMVFMGNQFSEIEANIILTQFGIAMVTTLMGLFIRVYYKQFSLTVEMARQSTQDELEDQVNNFNIQMRTLNTDLTLLTKVVSKNIKDIDRRNQRSLEAIEQSFSNLQTMTQNASDIFQKNLTAQFKEALSEIKNHSNHSLHELKTHSKDSLSQIKVNSQNSLVELQIASKNYQEAHKNEANKSLSTIEQSILKAHETSFLTVNEKALAFNQYMDEIQKNCQQLNQVLEQLNLSFNNQNKSLPEVVEEMNSGVEDLGKTYNRLTNALDYLANKAETKLSELQSIENSSSTQFTQTMNEYIVIMERLQKSMEWPGLQRLTDEDEQWLQAFEDRRLRFEAMNSSLAKHADHMASNVELFGQNMVDTASYITERLKEAKTK